MPVRPPILARFVQDREGNADLTALLSGVATAARQIAHDVNRAGLVDILGRTGERNVQGEEVQKLDLLANDVMIRSMAETGKVCIMGSEEAEEPILLQDPGRCGDHAVLFDPLDGSSNIDVAAPIGTIFSIFKRLQGTGPGRLEDLLQPGKALLAAGYVIYGSSTILVYTAGQDVHGFTLDPDNGDFLLTSESMRFPSPATIYSVNEANAMWWDEPVRQWVASFKSDGAGFTSRYIGSLVADFHRNLLHGGVFAYPADSKDPAKPAGKLRLLYEAAPLALVAHRAGGGASDGRQPILDIQPQELHQRTPLFVGNREQVDDVEQRFQAG